MAFAFTSFLGAFLLFQVQPMVARHILPWFGGTPAVWTTCMLFFQAVLLAGYTYAHRILRPLAPGRQALAHILFLAAAAGALAAQALRWPAPLLPDPALSCLGEDHPVPAILVLLTLGAALPATALAATAPVIQTWHAHAFPDRSPYKLYALSNIGSVAALLTYPFLVEPNLSLRAQAWTWTGLFAVYALACWRCAPRRNAAQPAAAEQPDAAASSSPPSFILRALWFSLAACGCLALLATTSLISQEIAVVPFLWIAPLTLYLLSFIVCFEFERFRARRFWTFAFAILSVAASFAVYLGVDVPILPQIAILNAALFALCMTCHGELVQLKPGPEHLTSFYLAIAAGGLAGGVFAGILAPLLFAGLWEFHVALLAALALVTVVQVMDPDSCVHHGEPRVPDVLLPGAALLAAFLFAPQAALVFTTTASMVWYYVGAALAGLILARVVALAPPGARWHNRRPAWVLGAIQFLAGLLLLLFLVHRMEFRDGALAVTRNFYGVLRVTEDKADDPEARHYSLRHGAILHGLQFRSEQRRLLPTAYYTEQSGAGLACRLHPRRLNEQPMRIGVIGLGVGVLAAYGQPGDDLRFYEINPEVIRIAQDTNLFTYLAESKASVDVVPGDARLSLQREASEGKAPPYDLLVVDAFTSDSIPAHLLTREAFALYLDHLARPGGWLALHISNRHVDLRPLLRAVADHFALDTLCVEQDNPDDDPRLRRSTWVLLARRGELDIGASGEGLHFNEDLAPVRLWTDDFSNLFDVLE